MTPYILKRDTKSRDFFNFNILLVGVPYYYSIFRREKRKEA